MHDSAAKPCALEAASLCCRRGSRLLFESLSFSVAAGELLQVVGPNGSGKTTLLRILCGLRAPDQGRVLWQGTDIAEEDGEYREALSYLGFNSGLKLELTPLENLEFSAGLASASAMAAEAALDTVGLSAFARLSCRQLSSGQLRRTALARLLMRGSPLWILDEPLTGLDQAARADFERCLHAHAANGGSIVLTTHFPLGDGGAGARRLELGAGPAA